MAFTAVRGRYRIKLAVGYGTVMAFMLVVAIVTSDAIATAIAGITGLLALGSITGSTSLATLN